MHAGEYGEHGGDANRPFEGEKRPKTARLGRSGDDQSGRKGGTNKAKKVYKFRAVATLWLAVCTCVAMRALPSPRLPSPARVRPMRPVARRTVQGC